MTNLLLFPYYTISGGPVGGLDLDDLLVTVFSVKKSDLAVSTVVLNAHPQAEVGNGMYVYKVQNVDFSLYDYVWTCFYSGAIDVDSSYVYGGHGSIELVDLCTQNTDVAALDALINRVLGLVHENTYLDQCVYDVRGNMTSGRIRIYSVAGSVGTVNDVLATYTVTSTYAANGNLTSFKVVKV